MTQARPATAQSEASIDLRTWRPSPDPQTNLILEPTESACRGCWNVAAWFAYAQDPVTIRNGGGISWRPVEHQLTADVTGGLGLGARFALGVDLPLVLWQDGSPRPAPASGGVTAPAAAPESALGDLSLRGKVTILSNDHQGIGAGLGLAAIGDVTFPTGSRSSYAAEGAVTTSLRVLGEYALGFGSIRIELGFALRPDLRTWSPDSALAPVTFGDSIPWAAALTLRPKAIVPWLDPGNRQEWELAAHGGLPAGPVAPFGIGGGSAAVQSPALLALDDRVSLDRHRDFYLIAGVEAGLDNAAGVPAVRGVLSLGWRPRAHDRDGDGVSDDVDQCPDLPEDKDGIQDADGCPEDDADGDGVPDDQDACPLAPGPASNDPKRNGCPAKPEAAAPSGTRP